MQPPTDQAKSGAGKWLGRMCSREPCTKDAHGGCQNSCCKFCCIVNGGCLIKDHNKATLSQTQLSKLAAAKESSSRNPHPPQQHHDSLLTLDSPNSPNLNALLMSLPACSRSPILFSICNEGRR
jgi:hypothetical protein